ncbi:YeiH family protein [Cohnella hongkongensis]|uniref:YeiH family protein n=1 Tax=Cohnella hongkongensis TaxID=178337 RepID=A0ABV9F6G0_9BACL
MQEPSYVQPGPGPALGRTPAPDLESGRPKSSIDVKGLTKGLILTAALALLAGQLASLPFFSILGVMIISILFGVLWKTVMDAPPEAGVGIAFSSKYLLRAGIVLMGLRLNIGQIAEAGISVIGIDLIVIIFTTVFMIALGHWMSVDKRLSALIAVGTAVCGAAAIAAVAPLIGAKKETTALSVASIAVLGTIGSVAYIVLYPYLGLDPYLYGVFAGSTLHELAHVIAAGAPAGDVGSDAAIVVKLGRVALLIPVALVLGLYFRAKAEPTEEQPRRASRGLRGMPIPWFIFGFLSMSIVNTLGVLPQSVVNALIAISVFLMSAAMAGLGLSIKLGDFKKLGKRTVLTAVAGFVALVGLGGILIGLFY